MYITVALAAWNGKKYIREQLDSIRLQTRVPDKVIVSDDASTDGTWEILQQYQKQWPAFPLEIYRNGTNSGYRRNFYRALSYAAAGAPEQDALFMLCDQDDIWMQNRTEVTVSLFAEHSDMSVLACSFILIGPEGERLPDRTEPGWSNQHLYHRSVAPDAFVRVPADDLIYHNFAQGCALAFRPHICGRFLQNFTDSVPHDWQIVMQGAAEKALRFYHHPLFCYRIHGGNVHGLHADAAGGRMRTEYRTLEAERAAAFLSWVGTSFPDLYQHNRKMQRAADFLKEDIRCIRERDAAGLLRILTRPEYRELKSKKAVLADLASVVLLRRGQRHVDLFSM